MAKKVNITLLSMCLVDAWKVWSLITVDESGTPIETKKKFYGHFAAKLIDNNYEGGQVDRRHIKRSVKGDDLISSTGNQFPYCRY
jgi:hypothetical protein